MYFRMRAQALTRIALAVALLLVGTGACTHAGQAAGQADDTYSLRRIFKVGDIDLYTLTLSRTVVAPQNADTQQVTFSFEMKRTTKSVSGSGQATLTEEYTKADAASEGKHQDALKAMPRLTIKLARNGAIEVTAQGGQEPIVQQVSDLEKGLLQLFAAAVPANPVKIGETWHANVPGLTLESTSNTAITVTLEGTEDVGGVKALRLKIESDTTGGPQPDTKVHSDSTLFLDAVTGKPLKMTSKSSGTAGGAQLTGELSLDLGAPDTAAKPGKNRGKT